MIDTALILQSWTGSGAHNAPCSRVECCLEGAIKVSALDECLPVSVKVHLVAVSLILMQEGCHREISFHLVYAPRRSPGPGRFMAYGYRFGGCLLCQLTSSRGRPPSATFPPKGCELEPPLFERRRCVRDLQEAAGGCSPSEAKGK